MYASLGCGALTAKRTAGLNVLGHFSLVVTPKIPQKYPQIPQKYDFRILGVFQGYLKGYSGESDVLYVGDIFACRGLSFSVAGHRVVNPLLKPPFLGS